MSAPSLELVEEQKPDRFPRSIYISCVAGDSKLRAELVNHLFSFRDSGTEFLHSESAHSKAVWSELLGQAYLDTKEPEIRRDENLLIRSAEIVIMLISAEYLSSEHFRQVVRPLINEVTSSRRLIPILVRPCDWESHHIACLKMMPEGAKPVVLWRNRDQIWASMASDIRKLYVRTSREVPLWKSGWLVILICMLAAGPVKFIAAGGSDLERLVLILTGVAIFFAGVIFYESFLPWLNKLALPTHERAALNRIAIDINSPARINWQDFEAVPDQPD